MSKNVVILTSYNRTYLLAQAIDSVVNQTEKDLKLMIIDDNSKPATIQVILDKIDQHKNFDIEYIQTNREEHERKTCTPYAQNINTCLRNLPNNAKYVYYLTCDDYYYPNHIELLSKYMDAHPEIMVVFGIQEVIKHNDHTKKDTHFFIRQNENIIPQAACFVDHNQVGHRVECIKTAGYWEEGPEHLGAGDAVFWNKLNKHYKFYKVPSPKPTNVHRFHKDSIQSLE